ncbi:MAG TPA: hypothetical protein VNX27_09165 [Chthoniobacterales bacterium]|jgi:putative transposase|nr:hypothetical protein [Chthoniobacterales bacterium]
MPSVDGRDGALRRPPKTRPVRKQLPHDVPSWVGLDEAVYFITICCQTRGGNQLTSAKISNALLESIEYRHRNTDWYMHLALLMPDHLHALIAIDGETSLSTRMFSIEHGLKWRFGNRRYLC